MKKNLKSRQGGKLNLSCREQKGKLMFPDGKEHVLLHVQKRSHIPLKTEYAFNQSFDRY